MQTRLTRQEVELVRDGAMQYALAEGLTHRGLLARVRAAHGNLTYYQVRDFMQGRRKSEQVAAAMAAVLPLGLVYMGPKLFYRQE